MNVLAELQKRGFQVQMCPGRVEIVSSLAMRQKAAEDGVTVWDQVNDMLDEIMSGVPHLVKSDTPCGKCGRRQVYSPEFHAHLCVLCGSITKEDSDE